MADSLSSRSFKRLVLSKPRPGGAAVAEQLQRITAKPALIKGQACLSLLFNHATRDITKNPAEAEAASQLLAWLGSSFSHGHLFTADEELQLLYSKRGKVSLHRSRVVVVEENSEKVAEDSGASLDGLAATFTQGHQRQKRHALSLDLPFLTALGVTDARQQLVPAMARKWKQINKFVEVLDHALDEARLQPGSEPLHVVDFGAGKGYLTFATHHHLTQQRHWPARVMGVELRPDLVTLCNAAVQRLGLEGLEFACGDVRSVVPPRVDVMIALHACDTATDHALHTGIRQGAAVILSSPCCHKQIRPQMSLPPLLKPMLQHGIHLGQQAEMLTDSLRALLLEAHGYQAQVFDVCGLGTHQQEQDDPGGEAPGGCPRRSPAPRTGLAAGGRDQGLLRHHRTLPGNPAGRRGRTGLRGKPRPSPGSAGRAAYNPRLRAFCGGLGAFRAAPFVIVLKARGVPRHRAAAHEPDSPWPCHEHRGERPGVQALRPPLPHAGRRHGPRG